MTVLANDIIRVTAKMGYGSETVQNVYHARISGGPAVDDDVKVALQNGLDFCYGYLAAGMTTGETFESIEVWNVTQDRPMGEDPWPSLVNGLATDDMWPPQCAILVRFPTLAPRTQGRKYLPPMREGLLGSSGTFGAAALTYATNYANAILAYVVLPTFGYHFGVWSSEKARFTPYNSAVIENRLQTQRRRTAGHGV